MRHPRLAMGLAVAVVLSSRQGWAEAAFAVDAALDTAAAYKPTSALTVGPDGRLYGVSPISARPYSSPIGPCGTISFNVGCGEVFAVSPPGVGGAVWPTTKVYEFTGGMDGATPTGDLVWGRGGQLFGTTSAGGVAGAGTVFALTPPRAAGQPWVKTTLHAFDGVAEGANPAAGLTIDSEGRLYGTAPAGGGSQGGTVFMMTPPPAGRTAWGFKVLHRFSGLDGSAPVGGLILRHPGGVASLFGTTRTGGPYDKGTVFRLAAPDGETAIWRHTILYSFTGEDDGALPVASLIADRSLTLFGVASSGGIKIGPTGQPYFNFPNWPDGAGVVFKLTPPSAPGGAWTQSVLHSFRGYDDGAAPTSRLYEDTHGILFGVTAGGGHSADPEFGDDCFLCGAVFKLTPRDYGGHLVPWNEFVIHKFLGTGDGYMPGGGLTPFDRPEVGAGLYGATPPGGLNDPMLFHVTP